MNDKPKSNWGFDIDVTTLSHENLVKIIEELRGSNYPELFRKAQKELVERLKRKGFSNEKIASTLIANEYGVNKKKAIAKEWAHALDITEKEFLRLISL